MTEWVSHGLNLPQYAPAFRANSVTALDFPLLLSDGGATLAADLGVTSRLHQQQVGVGVAGERGRGSVQGDTTTAVERHLHAGICMPAPPPLNPALRSCGASVGSCWDWESCRRRRSSWHAAPPTKPLCS